MISYNSDRENTKTSGPKPLPLPFTVQNVFSAHDYMWRSKFYFSGESHKYHEIVYVADGEITVSEDDRIYHLKKDELIVHAPYEFHRISTENGAHVLIFSFECDELLPEEIYDGFFILTIEEKAAFERLFQRVYAFFHGEPGDGERERAAKEIPSLLPAFFFTLAAESHSHSSSTHSKSEEEYRKTVETMRAAVYESLSLYEIAARNHLSVSYLKQLFSRYAGVGAKTYYTTLRLNEAIRLLEGGMSVAEVASRLNFSSPEYFSLFFKKQVGTPPGKWRSRNKTN